MSNEVILLIGLVLCFFGMMLLWGPGAGLLFVGGIVVFYVILKVWVEKRE